MNEASLVVRKILKEIEEEQDALVYNNARLSNTTFEEALRIAGKIEAYDAVFAIMEEVLRKHNAGHDD